MRADDFIAQQRFFLPSLALTKKIATLNVAFLKEKPLPWQAGYFQHIGRRELRNQQRTIAERVYRFLAAAAREDDSSSTRKPVEEFIPVGMSIMLGFPRFGDLKSDTKGSQARDCLDSLSKEFTTWLMNRSGIYEAPWGEVRIIQINKRNYLEFNRDHIPPAVCEQSTSQREPVPELTFTTR